MSLKRYNRSFKQGSCHLNEIFLFDFLSYLLVSVSTLINIGKEMSLLGSRILPAMFSVQCTCK